MSYPRIPNVIELELHWCHVCGYRLVPAVMVELAGVSYYFCEEHAVFAGPFADGYSGTPAVALSEPIVSLEPCGCPSRVVFDEGHQPGCALA